MEENIINKTYDFLLYLIPQIEKFPRSQKFLIADRIETNILDILNHLIRAYYSKKNSKVTELTETNIRLEQLRFLFRLCHDMKLISHKKFGILSEKLNEIGKMCGGWLKSIS